MARSSGLKLSFCKISIFKSSSFSKNWCKKRKKRTIFGYLPMVFYDFLKNYTTLVEQDNF